ncbi:MAG TPA: cupin domain-containing protein [Candidatus Sulfotelmatobacter sp.]|nr:cupin domain-containing protein [Candidatus Sulfotelmatobacter sp.]
MAKRAAKRATSKPTKAKRKPAPVARKAAARKSIRKAAARKPAARKPARKSAPKRAAKPAARKSAAAGMPAWPPQRFTVSHLFDGDFVGGLRSYARYRDLGTAAATGGRVQAHVIRMIPPVTDDVRKAHYHDVEFQMVYVLKGSMTTDFEGQGPVTMRAGSCWIQPPKIKHTVLDYSDDCEVLEIILPADFETVAL